MACVIAGYLIYLQTFPPEFEPYTSVFHIVFEDKTGVFLGNLTGEFKLEGNASNVYSTLTLAFCSGRLDFEHEPYIHNVTLEVSFAVMFFESGDLLIGPVPPSQRQTLKDGERVVFHNSSHDISKLRRPTVFISCDIRSYQTINDTIPSIQVYFSDGQVWSFNQSLYPLWQYKYEYPPGAIDVELRELSGKTGTTAITLTTVEKANPPPLLRARKRGLRGVSPQHCIDVAFRNHSGILRESLSDFASC